MSETSFRPREEIAPCSSEPGWQLFRRAQSVVSRVAGGETLVVPLRAKAGNLAAIYSFKGTGALIWQMLDVPRALPELAGAVEQEFGVGQEQARRDVTQFLDDMLAVGLVQTCQTVEATAIGLAARESQGLWETAGSR